MEQRCMCRRFTGKDSWEHLWGSGGTRWAEEEVGHPCSLNKGLKSSHSGLWAGMALQSCHALRYMDKSLDMVCLWGGAWPWTRAILGVLSAANTPGSWGNEGLGPEGGLGGSLQHSSHRTRIISSFYLPVKRGKEPYNWFLSVSLPSSISIPFF